MSVPRPNGLLVILALVVSGVGVTAGYLQWKAPEVGGIVAQRKREIAEAPKDPAGRLQKWLVFGAPQMHHRLLMMRFSAEQPWLVTHAVGDDPARLEIHGIDLAGMPREIGSIDGTTVVVRLPSPRVLTIGPLVGGNALSVPVSPTGATAPNASARARYLVEFALTDLVKALVRDIPEARLSIQIGPDSAWDPIGPRR